MCYVTKSIQSRSEVVTRLNRDSYERLNLVDLHTSFFCSFSIFQFIILLAAAELFNDVLQRDCKSFIRSSPLNEGDSNQVQI